MRKSIIVLVVFISLCGLSLTSALDVSVQVLDNYKTINSGEEVQFQVTLKNIDKVGRHDVILIYDLFKEDMLLTTVKELKAVETQTSFITYMTLPRDIAPGMYSVRVRANNVTSAEDMFSVAPKRTPILTLQYYSILLLVSLLFIASMILWEVRKMYRLQAIHELKHRRN